MLLVEALRALAELLIWGDQNDSAVFEYISNIFSCYSFFNEFTLKFHFSISFSCKMY